MLATGRTEAKFDSLGGSDVNQEAEGLKVSRWHIKG
jgi:hypothetical protein